MLHASAVVPATEWIIGIPEYNVGLCKGSAAQCAEADAVYAPTCDGVKECTGKHLGIKHDAFAGTGNIPAALFGTYTGVQCAGPKYGKEYTERNGGYKAAMDECIRLGCKCYGIEDTGCSTDDEQGSPNPGYS